MSVVLPSATSHANRCTSKPIGIRKQQRQTTLDGYFKHSCRGQALLGTSKSTASLKAPLSRTASALSLSASLGLPPPYRSFGLSMNDNHRVSNEVTKEAVQIVGFGDQRHADRVALNLSPTLIDALAPVLGEENGDIVSALSNVRPQQIMAVPMRDLSEYISKLCLRTRPKMRVKWWNTHGELATKRLFTYRGDTRGVTPATTLVLVMRAQGSNAAAQRVLALSPPVVAKELTRLGVNDYIDAANIQDVLSDAVFHIADPDSVGMERSVAVAAATAVAKYLHQQSASRKPEVLVDALVALLAESKKVHNADAAGAMVGVLLSGLFKYIEGLESDQRQMLRGVQMASHIGLSFLEEAPGGKVAACVLSLAVDFVTDAIRQRGAKGLREAVRDFVVDRIKFPLEKTGYLPGMDASQMSPFTEQEIGRFSRWLDLTLEANGFGLARGP